MNQRFVVIHRITLIYKYIITLLASKLPLKNSSTYLNYTGRECLVDQVLNGGTLAVEL